MSIKFGDEHLCSLEHNSGVYKIIINEDWYYIGSSVNLRSRLSKWKHVLQGGSSVSNRSIRYLLPQVKEVRFEILRYTRLGEDPKAVEDIFIGERFLDAKCLNLSPSAYAPKRKGCGKKHLGYVPRVKKTTSEPASSKKVAQFDLVGNLIEIHESIGAASRASGIKCCTIRKAFNGKSVKPTRFVFKRVLDDGSFLEPNILVKLKPAQVRFIVENYRILGNSKLREMFGLSESGVRHIAIGKNKCGTVCESYAEKMPVAQPKRVVRIGSSGMRLVFKSIGEAARSVGSKPSSVQTALLPGNENRTVKGYKFRYA